MKSRSNSSNIVEKQRFKDYRDWITVYWNWIVTCVYTDWATNWPKNQLKMTKSKNPIMVLKTNVFKSHNRLQKDFKKQQRIKLQYPKKPIGPVYNETKSWHLKTTTNL